MGSWSWAEILWVVAITIVLTVLLTRTRFGVRIIATGGNLVGAAEAGVPIRRVKVWCFVLCSLRCRSCGDRRLGQVREP